MAFVLYEEEMNAIIPFERYFRKSETPDDLIEVVVALIQDTCDLDHIQRVPPVTPEQLFNWYHHGLGENGKMMFKLLRRKQKIIDRGEAAVQTQTTAQTEASPQTEIKVKSEDQGQNFETQASATQRGKRAREDEAALGPASGPVQHPKDPELPPPLSQGNRPSNAISIGDSPYDSTQQRNSGGHAGPFPPVPVLKGESKPLVFDDDDESEAENDAQELLGDDAKKSSTIGGGNLAHDPHTDYFQGEDLDDEDLIETTSSSSGSSSSSSGNSSEIEAGSDDSEESFIRRAKIQKKRMEKADRKKQKKEERKAKKKQKKLEKKERLRTKLKARDEKQYRKRRQQELGLHNPVEGDGVVCEVCHEPAGSGDMKQCLSCYSFRHESCGGPFADCLPEEQWCAPCREKFGISDPFELGSQDTPTDERSTTPEDSDEDSDDSLDGFIVNNETIEWDSSSGDEDEEEEESDSNGVGEESDSDEDDDDDSDGADPFSNTWKLRMMQRAAVDRHGRKGEKSKKDKSRTHKKKR